MTFKHFLNVILHLFLDFYSAENVTMMLQDKYFRAPGFLNVRFTLTSRTSFLIPPVNESSFLPPGENAFHIRVRAVHCDVILDRDSNPPPPTPTTTPPNPTPQTLSGVGLFGLGNSLDPIYHCPSIAFCSSLFLFILLFCWKEITLNRTCWIHSVWLNIILPSVHSEYRPLTKENDCYPGLL